jgi:hypothetical protein
VQSGEEKANGEMGLLFTVGHFMGEKLYLRDLRMEQNLSAGWNWAFHD